MRVQMKRVSHQTGAALVVSLIILVLMTLIGVTAMQVNTVQEKIVSNTRDLNIAFQAAEAALRRGEQHVERMVDDIFSDSCATVKGLCRPSCGTVVAQLVQACMGNQTTAPQWEQVNWKNDAGPTLRYDENPPPTGVPEIDPLPTGSVARQPRYIIEDITPLGGGGSGGGGYNLATQGVYRITAQGYGQTLDDNNQPLAVVMLQSTYRK